MNDFLQQIRDYAHQLDTETVLDPHRVTMGDVHPTASPSRPHRRLLLAPVAAVGVLVLGLAWFGASGDDSPRQVQPAATTAAPLPLRATLELPGTKLPAGGTMVATMVVQNDTAAVIDVEGCDNLYTAGLDGVTIPSACGRFFRVPVGESRWPVIITTPASAEPGKKTVGIAAPRGVPFPAPETLEVLAAPPAISIP